MMDAVALHEAHPFAERLTFNEVMLKKGFDERAIPDESCIMGVDKDGKPHRFCVGNEQGEILPKFLMGARAHYFRHRMRRTYACAALTQLSSSLSRATKSSELK